MALILVALPMCGRFNLTTPQEVVARFGFVDWTDKRIEPRFNIAPSQEILTIVRNPLGRPFAQHATWGLKPFWFKNDGKRPPPINARAETLTTSPMFREALAGGRCLIPATGFYEWRSTGARDRQPMHIGLKDGQVFAFGGLWLPGKRGGIASAAIVTTTPNELMATIHSRMPAILRPEDEAAWLDPRLTDAQHLMALVKPYPAECMRAYPVASLVNSWEHEGPELIAVATPGGQLSL